MYRILLELVILQHLHLPPPNPRHLHAAGDFDINSAPDFPPSLTCAERCRESGGDAEVTIHNTGRMHVHFYLHQDCRWGEKAEN